MNHRCPVATPTRGEILGTASGTIERATIDQRTESSAHSDARSHATPIRTIVAMNAQYGTSRRRSRSLRNEASLRCDSRRGASDASANEPETKNTKGMPGTTYASNGQPSVSVAPLMCTITTRTIAIARSMSRNRSRVIGSSGQAVRARCDRPDRPQPQSEPFRSCPQPGCPP